MDSLRIVHLYPKELNLYGDSGNVLCLKRRLELRGISVKIIHIGIGDSLPDFDILFIGGGQDNEMKILANDIRRKSKMLSYAIENNKTILAICGGYQLLGEYYSVNDEKILLSEALPFYTIGNDRRMIGDIACKTEVGTIVGFENHSGKTYLSEGLSPLGKVIKGFGNNGEDESEGVEYRNTFGTYLHGPLLPKNPLLADEIIKRCLNSNELKPIDDDIENNCHNSILSSIIHP